MLVFGQESNNMSADRKPTSQKQAEANRRNARKSTGPLSASGRAISSQNARKHNLLPFEDPAFPAQITAKYYGHFIPTNKKERRLVEIMITSERIRRNCIALEARVTTRQTADAELRCMAEALAAVSRHLIMIPYQLDAAESAHRNACNQLAAIRTLAEPAKAA
jgi:hypothetical protein